MSWPGSRRLWRGLERDQRWLWRVGLRLRSAYTISRIQEAGELGSITEDEARRIKAPTLIIWGKYDDLANPSGADRLSTVIPGSRKVLIDNAGHLPQLERPAEFNRIVREFLKPAS